MIRRALRRRCPRCGGEAFDSYFRLREHCPQCGLKFEREPGYWVGAVIINTTVIFATFVAVFGGLVLASWPTVRWTLVLTVGLVANGGIPIAFYPISKTLWLALELSWHPLESEEVESARSRATGAEFRN